MTHAPFAGVLAQLVNTVVEMSTKSFLIDYGIPGVAAVVAGIATYMLTGGPEEFPSPEESTVGDEQRDDEYKDDCDEERTEDLGGGQLRTVPVWASELVASTKALSEEIRLLKEANQAQMQLQHEQIQAIRVQQSTLCSSCKKLVSHDDSEMDNTLTTVVEEVKPWTLVDWQTQLRCRIWRFAHPDEAELSSVDELHAAIGKLMSNSAASEHKETGGADLTAACELLLLYLTNLQKNPSVPRYRRISTVNASYAKTLSGVQGHAEFLQAVGFVRKTDSSNFEYSWHDLPTVASAAAESAGDHSASNKAGSVTSASGGSSGGGGAAQSIQRPACAADAVALLDEAIQLLTALKSGRQALAERLAALLKGPAEAEKSAPNEHDSDCSGGTQKVAITTQSAQVSQASTVTPAAAVAMDSAALSGGAVSMVGYDSSVGNGGCIQPGESYITVSEVLDEASGSAAEATAASLDFMQILNMAKGAGTGGSGGGVATTRSV